MYIFSVSSTHRYFFAIIVSLVSGLSFAQSDLTDTQRSLLPVTLRFQLENKPTGIIEKNEWRELAMDEALAAIDSTLTCFGPLALRQACMPIADKKEILTRQARLKVLCENPTTYQEFADDLAKVAAGQEALLNYYKDHTDLHTEAKKLYFSVFPDTLNNNRYILDASFLVDCGKVALTAAAFLGLQAAIKKLSLEQDEAQAEDYKKMKGAVLNAEEWHMPFGYENMLAEFQKKQEPFSNKEVFIEGLLSPFAKNKKSIDLLMDYHKHPTSGLILEAFNVIGFNAQLAIAAYGMYQQLRTSWSKPNELAKELRIVSKLINAATHLAKIAEQHPELSEWDAMIKLKNLGQADGLSDKLNQLMQLLPAIEHDTSMIMYSRGKILLAHKLLTDVIDELTPYIQAIGDVDALMSNVRLIKNQTDAKPWSFVTFKDAISPIIDSTDFWLPLLPDEQVVLNSVNWGNGAPVKIVLTGPNGGGKSTIMKSLAYQVVFAQSLGIVPARSTDMTIFNALRTGFNPQEDTKRGLSSFMAQRERMEEILNVALNAKFPEHVFVLVDEPYRGTVEATAQKLVFEFGQKIAASAQTMIIMASHFESPTTLPAATNNAYANYQCEFVRTNTGRLERSYRLLPGAATWWFHDDAMRSLYLACLDDAGSFLSSSEKK